jgi:hypothetical protein
MELIENTCLLSHVIAFMVFFGWNYIHSELIVKTNPNLLINNDLSLLIKNKCLEYLKITDVEYYHKVAQKFETFIH